MVCVISDISVSTVGRPATSGSEVERFGGGGAESAPVVNVKT